MASVLNYITRNSLPCKIYLDATKSSNISISGSNFTLTNTLGNTNYDFIQSDILFHPTTVPTGITFNTTEHLYSRNGNVFDNADSYTLINVVSGSDYDNNQLLNATKLLSTLPSALEYTYQTANIQQQHSRLSLYNYVAQNVAYINTLIDTLVNDIQTLVVNHNIKYGISSINVNQTGYIDHINTDKGRFDSNVVSNVYLGNSTDQSKPFTKVFKQLLLFIPQIPEVHIQYIVTKLLLTQIVWEGLAIGDWESIDNDTWDSLGTNL